MISFSFFHHHFLISGIYPKASHSSIPDKTYVPRKALSSADQEKLGAGNLLYQINGTNSSLFSRNMRILDAFEDEYGGVIVDTERLPSNPNAFASMLRSSLSHWKAKVIRSCLWLHYRHRTNFG